MTAAARIDAALALLGAPFVAGVLFLVAVAVAYVSRVERERRAHSDYLAPWRDREPGDLNG